MKFLETNIQTSWMNNTLRKVPQTNVNVFTFMRKLQKKRSRPQRCNLSAMNKLSHISTAHDGWSVAALGTIATQHGVTDSATCYSWPDGVTFLSISLA